MTVSNRRMALLACALLLIHNQAFAAQPATSEQIDYSQRLRRHVQLEGQEGQRFSIEERMRHYGVPGVSVAVVDECEIVDARGFGLARPEGGAVGPHTLFQAGSVSKVVATTGALTLVEEGLLSLDEDVLRHIHTWAIPRSEFAPQPSITLRELVTHSAGLSVAGFKGYPQGQQLPTLEKILAGASPANTDAVTFVEKPGTTWRYSGGGFVLTQLLMEQLSGLDFSTFMDSQVLKPASMKESTFTQPLDQKRARNAAHGTMANGEPIAGGWKVYPEQAAAGLWTTPTDLSRFGIELVRSVNGSSTLLRKDIAKEMLRVQIGSWGLGVDLHSSGNARKISHTGAPIGYRTLWLMYPDSCQGATIMTNSDEGMSFAYEVARALSDSYRWPEQMPSVVSQSVPMTKDVVNRFVGLYRLRDYPDELFEISQGSEDVLTWARRDRGRRDLIAVSSRELVSPDSGMRLVALANGSDSSPSDRIELHFSGGVNLAERVALSAAP